MVLIACIARFQTEHKISFQRTDSISFHCFILNFGPTERKSWRSYCKCHNMFYLNNIFKSSHSTRYKWKIKEKQRNNITLLLLSPACQCGAQEKTHLTFYRISLIEDNCTKISTIYQIWWILYKQSRTHVTHQIMLLLRKSIMSLHNSRNIDQKPIRQNIFLIAKI